MAFGPKSAMRCGSAVVGHDLAIDAALAHAAGDELRHLGAEVEDEDAVGVGLGHGAALHGAGFMLRLRSA